MDSITKNKILNLAERHHGRHNAVDVRRAADLVGAPDERQFREWVKELFLQGYLVLCIPRTAGHNQRYDYHGFCKPSVDDLKLYVRYHSKHTMTRLQNIVIVNDRIQELEQKKQQLEIFCEQEDYGTERLHKAIKDLENINGGVEAGAL